MPAKRGSFLAWLSLRLRIPNLLRSTCGCANSFYEVLQSKTLAQSSVMVGFYPIGIKARNDQAEMIQDIRNPRTG